MQKERCLFAVTRCATRYELGKTAAHDAANVMRNLLQVKPLIRMIFAAAPSQNEFLAALIAEKDIDFSRVIAFHMDEYVGLAPSAPQRFGNYLREHIFERAPFREIFYIDGNAPDIDAECERYAALLRAQPIDIVCMGIGENGHIAFNDPHEADFCDPLLVKKVALDEVCRMQQVHDGCFATLEEVPHHALTLTIPMLMNAEYHFCMVPAAAKARAVRETIYGPISSQCPATSLRLCGHAALYVDADSGALL